MVPLVTIDLDTVVMSNGIDSIFNFTLNWGIPFDNFDPIQNYFIMIDCIGSGCPLVLTADSIATSLDVSYTSRMTNVTIMMTASNTIGISDPATLEVASKYVRRVHTVV